MTAPAAPSAGYYPDPLDAAAERWWDGAGWTESVRPPEPVSPPEPAAEQAAPTAPSSTEPARTTVPPAYYPDPYGQAPLRWWDGEQWTPQVTHPQQAQQQQGVPPQRQNPYAAQAYAPGSMQRRPTSPSRRPGNAVILLGVLAALLVIVAGVGGGIRVLGSSHAAAHVPTGAEQATAVNLKLADLPAGWKVQPGHSSDTADAGSSGSSGDPVSASREKALAACVGESDHTKTMAFEAESPTFQNGGIELSSDLGVLRDAAAARQDLTALRSTKLSSCIQQHMAPALRTQFKQNGVTLTGLTVSKLPTAADGYAFRLRMALVSGGRSVTLYTDVYGFVRGSTEIEMTLLKPATPPDANLAARELRTLHTRANASVPQ